MRKIVEAAVAMALFCGFSVVVLGDDPCYELLDGGNCSDFYGAWGPNLGTSCTCDQQTGACTHQIYHDYAIEDDWNENRGYWEITGEGGYTGKEDHLYNCVTSGTCTATCDGNPIVGFTCVKNTPPTNQLFTIDDDRLKGIPCEEE